MAPSKTGSLWYQVGRSTLQDPIGGQQELPQSWNRYAYVLNSPLNYTDPSGNLPFLAILGAAWAVAEVTASIADGVEVVQVWSDSNASLGEKVGTTGLAAVGVFGPGGGYTKVDDVAEVANGVIDGARAAGRNASQFTDSAGRLRNADGTFASGGDHAAAAAGHEAHAAFNKTVRDKPNWQSQPRLVGQDGKIHIPDALSPSGRPVELKPRTQSGMRAGRRQLQRYEAVTGKKGRVIYYDK